MVALDQDIAISALEIVFPLCHWINNRQELPIVPVIVLFGRGAFLRVEIDWPTNPESVVLVEDAGICEAACLCLQNDWFLRVEMLENRCCGKCLFQRSKCDFGIPNPFPLP